MAPARTKELEAALQRARSLGRAAWPDVTLQEERFDGHLLRHTAKAADPVVALLSLHAADLFLACACLHGEPRALHLFEVRFLPEVAAFVAHIDSSKSFADELRQVLREHLLVGRADGTPPKSSSTPGAGRWAGGCGWWRCGRR